jgi:hypothetical protein
MSYQEKILRDLQLLLKNCFLSTEDNCLTHALNKDTKSLAESLYQLYAVERKLVKNPDFESKAIAYNIDLCKSYDLLRSQKWLRFSLEASWLYMYILGTEEKRQPLVTRLYVNTKVGSLPEVLSILLTLLTTENVSCPACNRPMAYSTDERTQICRSCGHKYGFEFKIHRPDPPTTTYNVSLARLLRNDKIVFYFYSEAAARKLAEALAARLNHKGLLDETSPLTNEVTRGIGLAPEPSAAQVEAYNLSMQEKNTLISFGMHVSLLIAEALITVVQKQPEVATKAKASIRANPAQKRMILEACAGYFSIPVFIALQADRRYTQLLNAYGEDSIDLLATAYK